MSNRKAPENGEFKGYPILKIHLGKKYQSNEDEYLSLGLKKCKAICDDIDYIRQFIEQQEGRALRK